MRWMWIALLALVLAPSGVWAQEAEGLSATGAVQLPDTSVEGVRMVTPVAVPNTYNLGESDPNGVASTIADTIRSCLQISGYFDVYGPDRYFFDPDAEGMTVASIDFTNWYNVGAQALVKTAFRVAGGQVSLDFRLYDVDNQVQIPLNWQAGTVREAVSARSTASSTRSSSTTRARRVSGAPIASSARRPAAASRSTPCRWTAPASAPPRASAL